MYIEFRDKGFENEVKKVLNISSNIKVTANDVLGITGILCAAGQTQGIAIPWTGDSDAFQMSFPNLLFDTGSSENGEWITDLQYFSHICSLHMYVPTQDLGFLRKFHKLRELYVKDSENRDWSFISSLTKLRFLYVRNCSFQDLTPLHDLHIKQEELYQEWKKENEGHWFYMDHLKNVGLNDCGISDISPLGECKWISELSLSHNQISDISHLVTMSSLYYVTLRYNHLTNISPLKDITGIYLLNLRRNNIQDISVLGHHKNGNLSRLFLGHNPIKDYIPIKKLRLIYRDINQFDEWKREKSNTQSEGVVAKEDMIGRWTNRLSHIEEEEIVVAFEENGTGFISWSDDDVATVDTFTWDFNGEGLEIAGVKRFVFEENEVTRMEDSDMQYENPIVSKHPETETIDGSFIESIRFSTLLDVTDFETFGLESRDVWNIDRYQKLKEIIWKE